MDQDSVFQWEQDESDVSGGWKFTSRLPTRPSGTILFMYEPSVSTSNRDSIRIRLASASLEESNDVVIRPSARAQEKAALCFFIRNKQTRLRIRAATNEEEHQFDSAR
jgi:hypothetical protein